MENHENSTVPVKTLDEPKNNLEENLVEEKKEKKKKKKWPIIILLLLLIAGGLAYYFLVLNKPKTNTIKKKAKDVKSEYRMSGNDLQDFDLYFLKLENEAKNKVYSPLSIKYALAMLSEGANGETKEQIDNIIGKYNVKKYPNSEHMSFANAMFIRDTYKDKIKEDYSKKIMDKYNAEVITDSFASPDNINNWVSNKTFSLVNNLCDNQSIKRSNYILMNALAIDMNWNYQLDCAFGSMKTVPCVDPERGYHIQYNHEKISDEDVEYHADNHIYMHESEFPGIDFDNIKNVKTAYVLADFNRYNIVKEIGEEKIRSEVTEAYQEWLKSDEGKSSIQYGYAEPDVNKYIDTFIKELNENYGKEAYSTDFMVYDDENVKAFAKDLKEYDGTTLQYVGIMPKEKELASYIKDVKVTDLNNIIKNLKELKKESFKDGVATIITGNIPFFKYEFDLKLLEDLKKLGIKDVFNDIADLSNMTTEKGAFIDDASHKANIEFSNEGIKASAATSVEGGATSGKGFNYLYKIPVEKIDISFNKPYMYLVMDKATGEVWFTGTVYEPIQK